MAEPRPLEQVFVALTQRLDANGLAVIIARQQSLVHGVAPADQRVLVEKITGSYRDRMLLRGATLPMTRMAICARRPDFKMVLNTPDGETWLRGEMEAVRALVREYADAV